MGKTSITSSIEPNIDHPKKVIFMYKKLTYMPRMSNSHWRGGGKWELVSSGTIDQMAHKSQNNSCVKQACIKVPHVSSCPSLPIPYNYASIEPVSLKRGFSENDWHPMTRNMQITLQ